MIKYLLILLFLFTKLNCNAQNYSNEYLQNTKELITYIREKYKPEFDNMLVIKSGSDFAMFDRFVLRFLRSGKFGNKLYKKDYLTKKINGQDSTLWTTIDSIELSNKERNYIIQVIENNKNFRWNNELLGDKIQITSQEKIDSVFKKYEDPYEGWGKFDNGYFELLAPVYIRNFSLCIFYWGHHEGTLAGWGNLDVYIKTNNGWEKFCNLYGWES